MKNNNLWSAIIDDMPKKLLYENADGIYNEHIYKYGFIQSIDFDQYCHSFCKSRSVSACKSVDTICYSSSNSSLYFVEFKDIQKSYDNTNQDFPSIEDYFNNYREREKDKILLKGTCSILLLLNKCKQPSFLKQILDINKKYFIFYKFPNNNLSKLRHNLARRVAKPYSFLFIDYDYMSIDNFDNFIKEDKIQFTNRILAP